MKRLHIHLYVTDIVESTRFYSALFAEPPAVAKPDYARWMLDDPRVNFAISAGGGRKGLDHLGIQAESGTELREVFDRLRDADRPVFAEGATTCCYAKSEKSWIADPQGVLWEAFFTTGASTVHGEARDPGPTRTAAGAAPAQACRG